MKEMHGILIYTNIESSTFEKRCLSRIFEFFIGNIVSKRENLKTNESYFKQISNRIRENYVLKNLNI